MTLENMNRLNIYIGTIIISLCIVGCTKEKRVPVYEHFYAPDSFSPNSDGLNEIFYVKNAWGILITNYHVTIYDEHLQLMYESEDITKGWNGNFQVGMPAPAGAYEYQIVYTASSDSVNFDDYITSSKINLIR